MIDLRQKVFPDKEPWPGFNGDRLLGTGIDRAVVGIAGNFGNGVILDGEDIGNRVGNRVMLPKPILSQIRRRCGSNGYS